MRGEICGFLSKKNTPLLKFCRHANFSSNDPFLRENGNADAYNFGTGVRVPGL